jgi:hypothetical protein
VIEGLKEAVRHARKANGKTCEHCHWWKERQPENDQRIGWCDYLFPEKRRGIKRADQSCRHWSAPIANIK